MNELQVFNNDLFGEIRFVEVEGKPYAVAKDVAKALGYSDTDQAIRNHCKRAISQPVKTTGQVRNMKVIPEGDIYRLITRSKLPSAEKFETWVFDEVLPQIRKTGGYIPINKEDDEKSIMAKGYLIAMKTIEKQDELLKQKDEQIKRLELVRVKGRTLNDAAACTGHPRKDIEEHCYKEKWYSKINGDVIIHKENLVTRKRKNAIEFTEEGFDLITKLFKKSKQKSII